MSFGVVSFLNPVLLFALFALPLLYWLLRATPPAPLKKYFPAVVLLLGLKDDENTPDRTPWWLLLLRLLAVALLIFAFAHPVTGAKDRERGTGDLVIALDASWASAQSWDLRIAKVKELLGEARQDNRLVALVRLSDVPDLSANAFRPATEHLTRIDGLVPNAWRPQYQAWAEAIDPLEDVQIFWLSDGLTHEGQEAFLKAGTARDMRAFQSDNTVFALRPIEVRDGRLSTQVLASKGGDVDDILVEVSGLDPEGNLKLLESKEISGADLNSDMYFDMPTELRNRVRFLRIAGMKSAATVSLADDRHRNQKIALLSGANDQESADLLSNLHYLRSALQPSAVLIEANLDKALLASPDIIVFSDIGRLATQDEDAMVDWVMSGGTLLRFAGPKLVASGIGQSEDTALLPVRLRSGGRNLGGTMTWGTPKKLLPFDQTSPFYGLDVPLEVDISAQVLAQPGPDLEDRTLARLEDGTPLVTRKFMGDGQVVLFHVTANAAWSSIPLSGLFVKMLERLSISGSTEAGLADHLLVQNFQLTEELSAFGTLQEPRDLSPVIGDELAKFNPNAKAPPGRYESQGHQLAMNAISSDDQLLAFDPPTGLAVETLSQTQERNWQGALLLLALLLFFADIIATLLASGGLLRATTAALFLMLIMPEAGFGQDQNDDIAAIQAANNTVLAYIETGNAKIDAKSLAGMRGLSAELFRRTAIEPIAPVGLNLEEDDLSLYPFIYWPIDETQALPSAVAVRKLNQFLRSGGMILFDTQDAHLASTGARITRNGRRLQEIAIRLDIPPLEPVPQDHVLTRSFYLLQAFPGRYWQNPVWVEAAPSDADQEEGVPFRNLNDGVTPVIFGAHDWAGAWAIDETGRYRFPVGSGVSGERQREIAQRFGVNLIMYVMTGNYKSDQVHIPALLDRLGQ